jgi:hypothetical protein
MNFVAQIGIADKIVKFPKKDFAIITMKTEKPFVENADDDWFDLIDIYVDQIIFKNELRILCEGSIIGIKGRISRDKNNNNLIVISERVQIF